MANTKAPGSATPTKKSTPDSEFTTLHGGVQDRGSHPTRQNNATVGATGGTSPDPEK